MDLKLLEDLAALARERSFVKAAEVRNITHPAFGRRIRALESWAGVALVDRRRSPVALTDAGQTVLQQAQSIIDSLEQTRAHLLVQQSVLGEQAIRIASGRTLARTLVVDWISSLARPHEPLHGRRVEVLTGSMQDTVEMLVRGEVDLLCCYEHPKASIRLSNPRFRHIVLAHDKLVPVCRANARGSTEFDLASGPLVAYASSLSLGAMMQDHFQRNIENAAGRIRYTSDAPDAVQSLVLKGLGIGWLPWSMTARDCKNGTLAALGCAGARFKRMRH